jgi:hypothetical protein
VGETAETNPFTGKSVRYEQVLKELEQSRLRTSLLEEALKQTNLREEAATVPLRKSVEAALARTNLRKEDANFLTIEANIKAAKDAQLAAVKATPKPGTKSSAAKDAALRSEMEAKVRAEQALKVATTSAVSLTPQGPALLSVLDISGARSVVLDFGGKSLVVADGGMTPAGVVRVKDDGTATVGGRSLSVHSATLGRFVVSDAKPEVPKLAPRVVSSANSIGGAMSGSGTPTKLPALQFPPGLPPLPVASN